MSTKSPTGRDVDHLLGSAPVLAPVTILIGLEDGEGDGSDVTGRVVLKFVRVSKRLAGGTVRSPSPVLSLLPVPLVLGGGLHITARKYTSFQGGR